MILMKKMIFTPGRTELAGNHTDHQKGRILAAGVALGLTAVFEANDTDLVSIHSAGYERFEIKLNQLVPIPAEFGTSKSLARGMLATFKEWGLAIGGFNAEITSTLPAGSGLSSSAAFSVLVGKILSELFNDGKVDPVVVARAAREAENRFFGKPCGLLDQAAAASGGVVFIDFAPGKEPVSETIDVDFENYGYALVVIDSGADHAGLTDDYASIPKELHKVCAFFGKNVLREVNEQDFYARLPEVRAAAGDRAVLRAMHIYDENRRVHMARAALKCEDIETFLRQVNASGRSSQLLLQNIIPGRASDRQALSYALACAERLLEGEGACRVHGGGFAGTIQAIVPLNRVDAFCAEMDRLLGAKSCHRLSIRPVGGVLLEVLK